MKLLPVALRVEGARVLVVGGGKVAFRKIRSLLECGARIKLVAPQLGAELEALSDQLEYSPRRFEAADCDDCSLIFACTDDLETNRHIAREAKARNLWCHVADDAGASTLHGAAVVRREEICIGITTGGGSPSLAAHLKTIVADGVGEEYAKLLQMMRDRRDNLKTDVAAQTERAALWRAVLDSEVLALLRAGQEEDAERLIDSLLTAGD